LFFSSCLNLLYRGGAFGHYLVILLGVGLCLPWVAAGAADKLPPSSKGRMVGEVAKSPSININTASAAELASGLKGVGLKRARDIVAYREKVGGFSAAEQLMDVKGIGTSVFKKNSARLVLK